MEDVHRAGGIMGIIGELERSGSIDTGAGTVAGSTLAEVLEKWYYRRSEDPEFGHFFSAAAGGKRTIRPYSQDARWNSLGIDRGTACTRRFDHPFSAEGGLAVLFGNLAEDGDEIDIDKPGRSFNSVISDRKLAKRRAAMEALPANWPGSRGVLARAC